MFKKIFLLYKDHSTAWPLSRPCSPTRTRFCSLNCSLVSCSLLIKDGFFLFLFLKESLKKIVPGLVNITAKKYENKSHRKCRKNPGESFKDKSELVFSSRYIVVVLSLGHLNDNIDAVDGILRLAVTWKRHIGDYITFCNKCVAVWKNLLHEF